MGLGPREFRTIETLRDKRTNVSADLSAAGVELLDAQKELALAERLGGRRASLQEIARKVAAAEERRNRFRDELSGIDDRITVLGDHFQPADPDAPIARLTASTPVLLLPVRLETRYTEDLSALLIRVFPDQIHVDAHEPELTSDESEAGRYYWLSRWTAGDDDEERETARAAFAVLARRFRPRRAAWIVEALTPVNMGPVPRGGEPRFPEVVARPQPWSRAAVARLLPTSWLAVGYIEQNGALVELFRKSGAVIPDHLNTTIDPLSDHDPPLVDGVATELPIDDGIRWLRYFDTAEQVGMAMKVTDDNLSEPFRGRRRRLSSYQIARLVVTGVEATMTAEQSAVMLERSLRAHVYSDGLSFLEPGTPTNNTSDKDSGLDTSDAVQTAAHDPVMRGAGESAGATRLAAALGVNAAEAHLDAAPGRAVRDQDTTKHMVNATWGATLGQTLDQMFDPAVTDAVLGAARRLAVDWLRPEGPYPTVRIGAQPYGLLPVVAASRYVGADEAERRLHEINTAIRGLWLSGANRAPRLARKEKTLTENMEELLQQNPSAMSSRFRYVYGPVMAHITSREPKLGRWQELARSWILKACGVPGSLFISSVSVDQRSHHLGAYWVQKAVPIDDATLSPNYLASIADEAGRPNAREALKARGNADTLLEAITSQAALYDLDRGISHILIRDQVERGVMAELPPKTSIRISEAPDVALIAANAAAPRTIAVSTPEVAANLTLPQRTGGLRLDRYAIDQLIGGGRDSASVANLSETIDSLRVLAERPAAELDRSFRGVLDAYSYRLDPWITLLATKRAAAQRAANARGVSLGGYGFVEWLAPERRPDSEGFVHAPSQHHAQTAAILRSGFLTQTGAAQEALKIDLSSRRVRLALGLLEGVAQGQSITHLLGYRLERNLREADIRLAKFILPLRRLFPIDPPPGESVLAQQEAIAARNVVDAVALLKRWREKPTDWTSGLIPAPSATERGQIEDVVADIADMFDAVSDLLVAEGVHQLVGSNLERASAALAGVDRQTVPVTPEVASTPRTGQGFLQRAGVLMSADAVDESWPLRDDDMRGFAEPFLNAWVGELIGKGSKFGFKGHLIVGDGSERDLDPVSLTSLELGPLALLSATESGGGQRQTELRERLASAFLKQLTATERDGDPTLQILPEAPADREYGLAVLEALLDKIRPVINKHRPASPSDLARPGTQIPSELDWEAIQQRCDKVRAAIYAARASVEDLLFSGSASVDDLVSGLDAMGRAGVSNVYPDPLERDLDKLIEQAELAVEKASQSLDREQAIADEVIALDAADERFADREVRRAKALLGESFTVLVPFSIPAELRSEIMASLRDRPALLDGHTAPLHGWLARMGEVKPRLGELADALASSEMVTGEMPDLAVVQLPHSAGCNWIGLKRGAKPPELVDLSIVFHPTAIKGSSPPEQWVGLVSDEWTEVIPSATETTAITFHYDAPGARPPQAMLLAVHPDPHGSQWRMSELLATVNEAIDLSRIRAVRPQDLEMLGALIPLIYLPDNYTRDVPGVDWLRLKAVVEISPTIKNVLGKG